ncbi:protein POLR1D-like [Helicoverpa armigera]|uniref:protein POLR1D-like n=1 Tax=Helicoverpa armigera TaxID=29058 RepID=UPI002112D7FC|nr:protein POLR1D-like [Helicoverpa armigera]
MTEKEDVTNQPEKEPLDDEALEKLAVEELMREAVQGAARAEIVGPSGWIKAPQNKTNKRFLVNTLRNAVTSNKYHSRQRRHSHKSPNREKHPEPSIKKDRSKRKH